MPKRFSISGIVPAGSRSSSLRGKPANLSSLDCCGYGGTLSTGRGEGALSL